jgi:hypothetical protein
MSAVTPGMVCSHHHLYSALARGMPAPPHQPTSFLEILEQVWWRLDVALDAEMIHWSAMLGAMEALQCGTTADRRPPRVAVVHRGQPVDHRRRLCARSVCARTWRTASPIVTARTALGAAWRRTSVSCAPVAAAWSACTLRSRARTTPCAPPLPGSRPGRGRAHPRGRGARRCRCRHAVGADGRRRLVAGALRVPRPRPAGHHRPQPAQQHEQLGRLRAPGRIRTGSCSAPTASAPTCWRRRAWPTCAAGGRRARLARHGVGLARQRLRAVPRGAQRSGHLVVRPRRQRLARRVHPRHPGTRRGGCRRRVLLCATVNPLGSTPPKCERRRPSRRIVCSRSCNSLQNVKGVTWRT